MEEIITISRHSGAIEWLKKYHPEFSNVQHFVQALPDDIRDKIVIGTLPINLAYLAKEYYHLSMDIPLEMRGKELTVTDMEKCNCKLEHYKILKI